MTNHGRSTDIQNEEIEAPRRKRWTRNEYHQIGDMGLLPGRYELIDGEILERMPNNPPHRIAVILLAAWLESIFGRLFVQSQSSIVTPVPDEVSTEPEPDIAVTRAPTTSYLTDNPGPADLLLVGEVSDTSLNYDLRDKANLYGASGIQEFWVLDLNGRKLYIHRLPSPDGYREVRVFGEDEQVATLLQPTHRVLVSSLLPPAVQN